MSGRRGRPRVWKTCKACGLHGRIDEDFYVWRDKGARRVSARCKDCTRELQRARYRQIMADPYLRQREAERKRNWECLARHREGNAERCRRYREKLKRERPEVYRQQLEDARIRNRQRNEGKPVRAKRTKLRQPKAQLLDPAPLVAFLKLNRLAAIPGPDGRIVFRLLHEDPIYVQQPVADRLITKLGGALSNVYPELYA